jgi:hypothetical protein
VLAVVVDRARHERRLGAQSHAIGLNGWSTEPNGVDFVTFPSSLVGEYWPFVRP